MRHSPFWCYGFIAPIILQYFCTDVALFIVRKSDFISSVCATGVMSENLDSVELEAEEKQDSPEKTCDPILSEEAKLKAKYPNLGQKPGGSDFLMKRLQKGQKYFDSGDYNMAKAKVKSRPVVPPGAGKNLVTGDHIPTPQDLPQRKPTITSKLAG